MGHPRPVLVLLVLCACAPDLVDAEAEAEGWSEASHSKDAEPDYGLVFPSGQVQRLDIWISADSYEFMQEEMDELYGGTSPGLGPGGGPGDGGGLDFGEDPSFVPVTVEYDGRSWPCVGMRYKGNSSLSHSWQAGVAKLPFRLDFDEFEDDCPATEDQRFWGFKKITFSPGYLDSSYLREALAVEIFRSQGVPAAMASFYEIQVTVEGEEEQYWGLYTALEDPSDAMMEDVFGDGDGNLYKPEDGCADWTCFDEDSFVKKSNEDEADYSDVIAAIEAMEASAADAEAWRQGLEEVFDVDGFLRWLATNSVMENWDTYGQMAHNYYLYADPGDAGRLTWIPWDNNESLQQGTRGSLSLELDEVGSDWPLIRTILDDPVYAATYETEVLSVLEGDFAVDVHSARAQELWEVIQPSVEAEEAPYTQLDRYSDFEDSVTGPDGLVEHVQERHALVQQVFGAAP